MPSARIDVRRPRADHEVQAIIEAVYLAQRDALKVPENDRHILYTEHRPERFSLPPGTSDNYTHIEITLFPGRSLAAKKNLYTGIIRRLGELGIAADDIFIILTEPPLQNWAIHGRAASEVELGFDLNV